MYQRASDPYSLALGTANQENSSVTICATASLCPDRFSTTSLPVPPLPEHDHRMRPSSFVLVPFVFLVIACGNVVVDGAAMSGSGGASTSMTTATTTSSGGSCGGCSKTVCPMFPPTAGSPCACCDQTCPYNQCPQDGSLATVTCISGAWSLQTESCEATSACGLTQCTPGFVCLHHVGGPVTTMPEKCIPNPCGTSPLACSCATSVCPADPGDTCSVMGSDLYCGCSLCQ
jgi:hypothetical protein